LAFLQARIFSALDVLMGAPPLAGRDRTLHRAGDRNVCDAKSRLVCAGRELRHLSIMAEFTVNPKF
jgi:hypothetical protein